MAYDNPYQDPMQTPPNQVASPWETQGQTAPQPNQVTQQPAQPKGGYDLEAFRKRWMQSGNVNDVQGWLGQNQDITSGVTLKNEKAFDPSGKFIADLVGNYSGAPTSERSRIFLDGIGSNGKPRAAKPAVPAAQTGQAGTGAKTIASSSSQSVAPIKDPRLDTLYNILLGRAQQSLDIGRSDPIIRAQADAYGANQERASRNYLADLAEKSGPLANLRGEQRMASERTGQATGAFEAELMGRELTARRQEILSALNSMQGLLSTEQQLALQNKLALIDDATRRLSIGNQDKQFYSDLDYRNRALSQSDSQFRDRLGFDYADRSNYWDAFYRGLV